MAKPKSISNFLKPDLSGFLPVLSRSQNVNSKNANCSGHHVRLIQVIKRYLHFFSYYQFANTAFSCVFLHTVLRQETIQYKRLQSSVPHPSFSTVSILLNNGQDLPMLQLSGAKEWKEILSRQCTQHKSRIDRLCSAPECTACRASSSNSCRLARWTYLPCLLRSNEDLARKSALRRHSRQKLLSRSFLFTCVLSFWLRAEKREPHASSP